jgi:hypothetical protein
MNKFTRELIDVAFRWQRYGNRCHAADNMGAPPPPVDDPVLERAMDALFPDVAAHRKRRELLGEGGEAANEQDLVRFLDQHMASHYRISMSFQWFVRSGCVVVSLPDEVAHSLAETDAPADPTVNETRDEDTWRHSFPALILDVGTRGCALLRCDAPEDVIKSLMSAEGVEFDDYHAEAIERGGLHGAVIPHGDWSFDAEQTVRLLRNVGFVLTARPEGLAVTERHPSPKAAKKRGEDPTKLPSVEYIIGSTCALERPAHAPTERADGVAAHQWRVRSLRRGHWAWQPHGPKASLRKRIWRMPAWCGPQDAPLSVHSTRISPNARHIAWESSSSR